MKKVTLFLLLAISILLFGSAQVFAQSGGTGTSGDPYLISNLTDLQWLSLQTQCRMGVWEVLRTNCRY